MEVFAVATGFAVFLALNFTNHYREKIASKTGHESMNSNEKELWAIGIIALACVVVVVIVAAAILIHAEITT